MINIKYKNNLIYITYNKNTSSNLGLKFYKYLFDITYVYACDVRGMADVRLLILHC